MPRTHYAAATRTVRDHIITAQIRRIEMTRHIARFDKTAWKDSGETPPTRIEGINRGRVLSAAVAACKAHGMPASTVRIVTVPAAR